MQTTPLIKVQYPMSIRDLPYPMHIGIKHVRNVTLSRPLQLEQWTIPAGITVKVYQSNNFGVCVLPKGTKTTNGSVMLRRIFLY